MRPGDGRALLALLALALALRAWNVTEPPVRTGDEPYHVPAAERYCASGRMDDTTWSQPPLAPLLLCASMRVAGDGPWGWRLRSVVLGAIAAVALALLAGALFPGAPRHALAAGLLLAVDPLHVVMSRSTLEEVQAAAFFLLGAWLCVRYARDGARGLVLAGILLGCAHASKAYFHAAALVLLGLVLAAQRRRGASAAEHAHAIVALAVLPAAVYLATYLPWFSRGYGLGEFVDLQVASWRALGAKELDTFEHGGILALGGPPSSWFVRPALFGFRLPSGPGELRLHAFATNPVVWLAVLPAVAAVAIRAVLRRDPWDGAAAALFAATYVPLLLLDRPIFLYSALAVLPLGLVAVARAAALVGDAAGRVRRLPAVGLAVACAGALYLYPLATALPVPRWAYAPFASSAALLGPGR